MDTRDRWEASRKKWVGRQQKGAEREKGLCPRELSLHSREKGKGEVPRLLLLLATLVEGSILPEIHVNQ
jgi:hypothetical protein